MTNSDDSLQNRSSIHSFHGFKWFIVLVAALGIICFVSLDHRQRDNVRFQIMPRSFTALLVNNTNNTITNNCPYGEPAIESAFKSYNSAENTTINNMPLSPFLEIPTQRCLRFPTVDERVRLYMSDWYHPPCSVDDDRSRNKSHTFYSYQTDKDNKTHWRILACDDSRCESSTPTSANASNETSQELRLSESFEPDTVFVMDRETIEQCAKSKTFRMSMRVYCHDVTDTVFATLVRAGWDGRPIKDYYNDSEGYNKTMQTLFPLLFQFGDSLDSRLHGYLTIPHLKKVRPARSRWESSDEYADASSLSGDCMDRPTILASRNAADVRGFQPIIWLLGYHRHYGNLQDALRYDTNWFLKRNKAIWRGAPTGPVIPLSITDEKDRCFFLDRCRFVFNHHESNLVDAKLTAQGKKGFTKVPPAIDGVQVAGNRMSLDEMLQYKAIIMLEGNDVASGLKWALLSQSVVLMQPPACTTFAMEELLEPWVHYIPLNEDLSDAEEMTKWVVSHDEQARQIGYRGSLWIYDLIVDKQAMADNEKVFDEILRRYRAHFVVP